MWTTSGLFCSGQSSPDMQYPIRERVRTHPTGASGRSARHDAQPSAFSIRTDGSRAPVLSATPDTTFPSPHGRKNPPRPEIRRPGTSFARKIRLARKIRRPGTSFARKIYLNRKSAGPEHRSPGKSASPTHVPSVYRRPVLHSTRHPSCPPFSRSALLHRHVSHPFPLAATRAAHRPSRRMACLKSRAGAAPIQICRPDRMPRQKERQPAGAAALRQSDSGPIICC